MLPNILRGISDILSEGLKHSTPADKSPELGLVPAPYVQSAKAMLDGVIKGLEGPEGEVRAPEEKLDSTAKKIEGELLG